MLKKIIKDNIIYYYNKKGELHREDGPAIVSKDTNQFRYYTNGKLHRAGGPAVIGPFGYLGYYNNNKLHREDGPAVIFPNYFNEYWFNGHKITNISSNEEYIRLVSIKTFF